VQIKKSVFCLGIFLIAIFCNQDSGNKKLTQGQIDSLSNKALYLVKGGHNRYDKLLEEKLSLGANPNVVDANGTPAIVYAAKSYEDIRLNFLKSLVEHGADLELKNKAGQTAFFWICVTIDTAAIRYLINKGANAHVVDTSGMTPLQILTMSPPAMEAGFQNKENASQEYYRYLKSLGNAKYGTQELLEPYVKLLLKNGADPLFKGPDGMSPLDISKKYNLNIFQKIYEDHIAQTGADTNGVS